MLTEDATSIVASMESLISKGWCNRRLACNAAGESCGPLSKTATSWCLIGAALRATHDTLLEHAFAEVRDALREELLTRHMFLMWCDDTIGFGQKEALDVLRKLRS